MMTRCSEHKTYANFRRRTLIPPFCGKRGEKFSTFIEKLERHFEDEGLPRREKAAALLSLLGGAAHHFVLAIPAHYWLNYDEMKQALAEKYCDPNPGVNPDDRENSAPNSGTPRKVSRTGGWGTFVSRLFLFLLIIGIFPVMGAVPVPLARGLTSITKPLLTALGRLPSVPPKSSLRDPPHVWGREQPSTGVVPEVFDQVENRKSIDQVVSQHEKFLLNSQLENSIDSRSAEIEPGAGAFVSEHNPVTTAPAPWWHHPGIGVATLLIVCFFVVFLSKACQFCDKAFCRLKSSASEDPLFELESDIYQHPHVPTRLRGGGNHSNEQLPVYDYPTFGRLPLDSCPSNSSWEDLENALDHLPCSEDEGIFVDRRVGIVANDTSVLRTSTVYRSSLLLDPGYQVSLINRAFVDRHALYFEPLTNAERLAIFDSPHRPDMEGITSVMFVIEGIVYAQLCYVPSFPWTNIGFDVLLGSDFLAATGALKFQYDYGMFALYDSHKKVHHWSLLDERGRALLQFPGPLSWILGDCVEPSSWVVAGSDSFDTPPMPHVYEVPPQEDPLDEIPLVLAGDAFQPAPIREGGLRSPVVSVILSYSNEPHPLAVAQPSTITEIESSSPSPST